MKQDLIMSHRIIPRTRLDPQESGFRLSRYLSNKLKSEMLWDVIKWWADEKDARKRGTRCPEWWDAPSDKDIRWEPDAPSNEVQMSWNSVQWCNHPAPSGAKSTDDTPEIWCRTVDSKILNKSKIQQKKDEIRMIRREIEAKWIERSWKDFRNPRSEKKADCTSIRSR